jgi:phage-related minor tail protein
MASTKVRGITIELGADTSGLSKALKGVNTEIGKTQKDLKDVERLLKLDPSNTELLAQKQKLLNDQVAETKTKLDALKQAQESIDLSTEDGQRQYDALTREIVSCENELKEAEQAASSFNATAQKISVAAGNMSKKFGDLANKTKGLSMAAGGALAGLAGLAVKAGQDADELSTLSKQTGIATDELQKMQYASDLIDVDVDTITGSLKKMKKGLDSNADAFEELGVATKENGQFRDITDIFYDTVDALSQIPNETERDIKAMEIFGKSADDLAGIIDDGGASLKSLGEEAENLGVIISDEDLEKANELNDTLDKLKAEIMPTIAQLGVEIAEAILPYLPTIKEAIDGILEALRNVSPQTVMIVGGILAATAALSPLFSVLSSLSGVISSLTGSAGALSGVLGGLSAPILAIVAAIGVAVAAFMHLWNTNEEFRNNIIAIWDGIKAKFEEFGQGIVERLNKMGFDFQSFGDVVKTVWDWICDYLAPVFTNAFDAVAAVLGGALDVLTGLFDVFAGLFTGNWEQMWNGVKEIFEGIWDAIVGVLKGAINIIINAINGLIDGVNKIGFGEHKINIPLIPMLADGGILTSGMAIVGEAGPELVQVSNGQAMVQPLNSGSDISALLETYLPYLAAGTQLVLDSGALVGGIAPDMNVALGTLAIRGGRR